jgi:CubicO group peptidase (beta-lactamase class C family)
MIYHRLIYLVLAFFFVSCTQADQESRQVYFQSVNPEEYGISADSLDQVTRFLESAVEAQKIPGAVAMILKDGQIIFSESVGFSDTGSEEILRDDHIFRIASMTKPITSLAILMLGERGDLNIMDPVSDYIPEFSDPQVLQSINFSDTTWTSVPASRDVTIHDLLTHTSGIAYGFTDSTMNAIYTKAGVPDGIGVDGMTIAESMSALGELPLKHQPGENWTYGLSTDVLGRVVEVVSGQRFDRFLQHEIFDPLGMVDTGFVLNSDHDNRLVPLYQNPDRNTLEQYPTASTGGEFEPDNVAEMTYFSGGAGLMSTATDYQRIMQAILNGGELEGNRIFGDTVSSWLFEHQMGDLLRDGDGFSYGFSVTMPDGNLQRYRKPGRLSWGGLFQTTFWIDPARNTSVVLMTQVFPSHHQQEIYKEFEIRVNRSFME